MDDKGLKHLSVHDSQWKPKLSYEDPQMFVNWLLFKTQLSYILHEVRLQLQGHSLHILLDIYYKYPCIFLFSLLVEYDCVLHASWVVDVDILEVYKLA